MFRVNIDERKDSMKYCQIFFSESEFKKEDTYNLAFLFKDISEIPTELALKLNMLFTLINKDKE